MEAMPFAPLKIISIGNQNELGMKIDSLITARRKKVLLNSGRPAFKVPGYDADSYLVPFECQRFSTGEGKAVINKSIRGSDLYIIADTTNYSNTYKMRGCNSCMSPDDYFMDIKRVIMACGGHPRRITVIMPYLYEGRQHVRINNESLDCAQALQELAAMGTDTIITFDAHDSRVQNAIPTISFENLFTSYQFISAFLKNNPGIKADKNHLMIISPDEGGMRRAVYYASLLGVDMGMFYKRRDYSRLVDGIHPVVSIEFLGNDVYGKDVVIVDDMIASGRTVFETAKELRKRNAGKIIICATFGLFSNGADNLDEAYRQQVFDEIYTTNLCYCPDIIKNKNYYHNVDLSSYISLVINTLNHDISLSGIMDASQKIKKLLADRN
ncbi:MAG: ribose-phosphate pyrophosphokinase [Lachnospiraceae bacterium]